jgi:hypothetical protein
VVDTISRISYAALICPSHRDAEINRRVQHGKLATCNDWR